MEGGSMEQRICGKCTACCKTHAVYELDKPAGNWCAHCNIGQKCRIYKERPKSCQEFKCVWLMGNGGSKLCRPDKVEIVADYRNIPGLGTGIFFFEAVEGALNSEFTKKWTRRNLEIGNRVVHVSLVGNSKLYLPDGEENPDMVFRTESGEEVEIITFVSGKF